MIIHEAERRQDFFQKFGDQPELHPEVTGKEVEIIGPRRDGSATLIEEEGWDIFKVVDFVPFNYRYIRRVVAMEDTAANRASIKDNSSIGELLAGSLYYPTGPHLRNEVQLKRPMGSPAHWLVDMAMYVLSQNKRNRTRHNLTTLSYTEDHLTEEEIESGKLRLSSGVVVSGKNLQEIFQNNNAGRSVDFNLAFHYQENGEITANVRYGLRFLGEIRQGEGFHDQTGQTRVCFTPVPPDRLLLVKRSDSLAEGARWRVNAPVPINHQQIQLMFRTPYMNLPRIVEQIIP